MDNVVTPEPTEETENGMDTENTPIPEVSATPITIQDTPSGVDYTESLQTIILNQERSLLYEETTAVYVKACAYILCVALFVYWLMQFMDSKR